jgi:hypothetical protein
MDLQNQLQFLGIQDVSHMFSVFRQTVFLQVRDPKCAGGRKQAHRPARTPYWIGHFCFLMRSVMMRHSQDQKYRGTQTSLMSLPPKVSIVYRCRRTHLRSIPANHFDG